MIKTQLYRSVPQEAIFCYSLEDCLGVPKFHVQLLFQAEAWVAPAFIPGAKETLNWLCETGHKVIIFTQRWLYLPNLQPWVSQLDIPCSAIALKADPPAKCDLTDKIDIQIDDRPSDLFLLPANQVRHRLLFTQPWNKRCLNIFRLLRRVDSWAEIKDFILGLGELGTLSSASSSPGQDNGT